MNQVISDFIFRSYLRDCLKTIIRHKTLLQEALGQPRFLKALVLEYTGGRCWEHEPDYDSSVMVLKSLEQFPDKFLGLPSKYFVPLVFCITGKMWSGLSNELQQKILKQVQGAIKSLSSEKTCRRDISPGSSSFLLQMDRAAATQILVQLHSCYNLQLPVNFLSLLRFLSPEALRILMTGATIHCNYFSERRSRNDLQEFESLTDEYQQIFLQAVLSGKVKNYERILTAKSISMEFLDKYASELLEGIFSSRIIKYILRLKSFLPRQQSSRFLLLAALQWAHEGSNLSTYLSREDLERYTKKLRSTQKRAWAGLLQYKNIMEYPLLLTKALKCYCSLSKPPTPPFLEIPDEIISKLTAKQLAGLVRNEINYKGAFEHLKCNPLLIAQKLSPIALTQPKYYQEQLAEKISSAIERYQVGI